MIATCGTPRRPPNRGYTTKQNGSINSCILWSSLEGAPSSRLAKTVSGRQVTESPKVSWPRWRIFGVTSEPLCGHVGITLGSLPGHMWVTSGSLRGHGRGHFGITLWTVSSSKEKLDSLGLRRQAAPGAPMAFAEEDPAPPNMMKGPVEPTSCRKVFCLRPPRALNNHIARPLRGISRMLLPPHSAASTG